MKNFFALLAFGLMAVTANASSAIQDPEILADIKSGKIVNIVGTEATYVKSADKSPDGKITMNTATYFLGERVVKASDGSCQRVETKLAGLSRTRMYDVPVELPILQTTQYTVDCPK